MEIRFLQEEDKLGICQLSYQINQQHHANDPRYFREPLAIGDDWDFWRQSHEKPGGFVLVGLLQQRIIGFIAAEIYPMPNLPFLVPMTRCRIATLVVADDQQRKGIGTALFKKTCVIATERGATDISLEVSAFNSGAYKFYQKLGLQDFAYRMCRPLV